MASSPEPSKQTPAPVSSTSAQSSDGLSGELVRDADKANRRLVLALSIALFVGSGLLIFANQTDTFLKQLFLLFSFSFSLGGFFNLLTGKAKVRLGNWFIASGGIAVATMILALLLQSAGLINLDMTSDDEIAWRVTPIERSG